MRKARVRFIDWDVEFIDRDLGIKQVEELAERGTYPVHVIYGPEGCGKTAFLKQATEILREHGYSVVHVNPMEGGEGRLGITDELRELLKDTLAITPLAPASALIDMAVRILYEALRRRLTRRIALLADDVFQAVGLDRAELLVKGFLNMIEHPQEPYERIVVLVASSEGLTRERIGRHSWAVLRMLWNMPMDGFKELYDLIPNPKPPFDYAWRWTGGNPRYLGQLYRAGWDVNHVINRIIKYKELDVAIRSLSQGQRQLLARAVEDPDVLYAEVREAQPLIDWLMERNLVIRVWDRNLDWVDTPPPEKDLELGIGRDFAWQTPIHREAVKRVLGILT
ncbi:ATP-binding protein [Vulcanisaeta thermophila]|uniref:ATP-binding protein n=1 Tax=Vulcanisaeta thermophila TaxID=867917 RepID=UPI00085316DC|nr:ATP-binding protein [Vulcanisaeta thermophila]